MSGVIIDHSNTPAKRSTGNTTRLTRRMRETIKKAVNKAANEGTLESMSEGIKAKIKPLSQPTFQHDRTTGHGRKVFPGNTDFVPGDLIDKPPANSGKGTKGGDGDGEDSFIFEVPPELARELLLEDLGLPNLTKMKLAKQTITKNERAGFKSTGPSTSLALTESATRALSRRIALHRPKRKELQALQEQIDELGAQDIQTPALRAQIDLLQAQLDALKRKRSAVPFMDTGDLRYRRYEPIPQPITQAVMFCLMDVSSSMGEHEKDLSKRFYWLLHLLLTGLYDKVELIFIQHTDDAAEVTQHEFFFGQSSGGTTASSALVLMNEIIEERFPLDQWNIYGCQCSDGDDGRHDAVYCQNILEEGLLQKVQYFWYLEVGTKKRNDSPLWISYDNISAPNFKSGAAWTRDMIYPLFRTFFEQHQRSKKAA